jgi:Ca-activated chloride channel homolog
MTRSRFALPMALALAAVLVLGAARDVPGGVWTRAGDDFAPQGVTSDDLSGPDGPVSPFLLGHTDVRVTVTGPVAHTVVVQEWRNPNRDPVDGLYIFPLPDNAAVTAMSLRIGRRVIEAEMHRREEARAVYEQARAEGRIAGLLDQERPNIFAQRVANITPGTAVEVTLEFDQEVRCDDGACAYILPTVVGPRFIPDRQTDPGAIAPPVAAPGAGTGQTLSFVLDLDAGIPTHDVASPSHAMRVDTTRSGRATVTLTDERARLDRDVEVRWRLGGRDPEFGVLAYRGESDPGVFALYVQPPVGGGDPGLAAPRELVFLLDCSGSMSGRPIEAAKGVVRRALGAARPQDTLQILRFSDRASGLWSGPVPATPANIGRALAYLDTLRGEGGTEMLSGVRAALDRPADPERLRIVAFLTDGYIGNEDEILGEVRRLVGDARLFAFGIGSSVNRYLLESLAQEGRGAAAFLMPGETPDDLVRRFTDRIATPVFTDIRLSWEGIDVDDQEPALVPDLFAGQPLVIHGRYHRPGAGALVLEGRLRGRRETLRRAVTLPAYAADNEALGRLWARARVDRLTRESYGRPHPDTVAAITDLGLRFHLMTPYTSLVAVDSVVSNRGGESQCVDVPVEMPAGVSYEGIFGHAEQEDVAQPSAVVSRLRALGYVGAAPPAPRVEADNRAPRQYDAPSGAPEAHREKKDGSRSDPAAGDSAGTPPQAGSPSEAGPSPSFLQIVLIEEDGTRRTLEDDGEAWLADTTTRRLVRTLTSERLADLRAALAAAGVDRWQVGEATWARGRSRLVVVSPGGIARSVALPSATPAIRSLADLVRAATS